MQESDPLDNHLCESGGRHISAFDKAISMNSTGFFGLHVITAGTYEGELYEQNAGNSLKRLFIADGSFKIILIEKKREGRDLSLSFGEIPL